MTERGDRIFEDFRQSLLMVEELKNDEGCVLKPYKDSVGKLTLGIGRNLDDVGISQDEADFLLMNDIRKAENEALKFSWYSALTPARKRVVINMIFNLGMAGFSKFKQTISYIERGMYDKAACSMMESRWAGQVGRRAIRLQSMMRDG